MKSMPTFGPRARWKAVAITATDPVEFAQDYEAQMNALVGDGWNITGMMTRGDAVVITAQKPELPASILEALATVSSPKTKVVTHANTTEEVIYSYQDEGKVQSMRCVTLEEAVKYLEEHIVEDGAILPISITVMTVTSYEPADLPTLRDLIK